MQIKGAVGVLTSFASAAPCRLVAALAILLLPVMAFSQFCPGCVQNSSLPQAATFNLTKGATIQGLLDVGQISVGNFYVSSMTAAQFAGGGAGLTNLNA
jgi:hypothetical protein